MNPNQAITQTEGRFVFSRPARFDGRSYVAGDPVPAMNPQKLQNLFKNRDITYAAKTTGIAGKGK